MIRSGHCRSAKKRRTTGGWMFLAGLAGRLAALGFAMGASIAHAQFYAPCVPAAARQQHTQLHQQDLQLVAQLNGLSDDCSAQGIALSKQRLSVIQRMLAISGRYSCGAEL